MLLVAAFVLFFQAVDPRIDRAVANQDATSALLVSLFSAFVAGLALSIAGGSTTFIRGWMTVGTAATAGIAAMFVTFRSDYKRYLPPDCRHHSTGIVTPTLAPPNVRNAYWTYAAPLLAVACLMFWSFPASIILSDYAFIQHGDHQGTEVVAAFGLVALLSPFPFMLAGDQRALRQDRRSDAAGAMLATIGFTSIAVPVTMIAAVNLPLVGDTGGLTIAALATSFAAFAFMHSTYREMDSRIEAARAWPAPS